MSAAAAMMALLAACSTRPVAPSGPERDGPGADPPPNLLAVPDAEPRVEPLRAGGPNKPYEVLGQSYMPMTADLPLVETGGASWYGRKFHGKPTASGERYDMYAMTAAHKTMPLPSYARVRNPANGRAVVVRVNDRGPFASGRVIDLSYTAALKLGLLGGVAPVHVQRLTHDDIRSGRWRGPGAADGAAAGASAARPTASLAAAPPAAVLPARADPATLLPDDPAPGDVPALALTASQARGWWLQFGAFRGREAALALQQRLHGTVLGATGDGARGDSGGQGEPAGPAGPGDAGVPGPLGARTAAMPARPARHAFAPPSAPLLAVFDDAGMFRVQAGPWPTRAQAQAAADRMRQLLGSMPLVLERGAVDHP